MQCFTKMKADPFGVSTPLQNGGVIDAMPKPSMEAKVVGTDESSLPNLASKLKAVVGIGRPSRERPARIGPVQAKLLAFVGAHPDRAHGAGIAEHFRQNQDPAFGDAQAYVAIKRLEARGFLVSVEPPHEPLPSKRSQGRPHKYYSLTASGRRALEGVAVEGLSSNPGVKRKGDSIDDAIQATREGQSPVVG